MTTLRTTEPNHGERFQINIKEGFFSLQLGTSCLCRRPMTKGFRQLLMTDGLAHNNFIYGMLVVTKSCVIITSEVLYERPKRKIRYFIMTPNVYLMK